MDRRYKLRQDDKPATLATLGGGDTAELYAVNKAWGLQSNFTPWNPGMEVIIPPAWEPIAGEYTGFSWWSSALARLATLEAEHGARLDEIARQDEARRERRAEAARARRARKKGSA